MVGINKLKGSASVLCNLFYSVKLQCAQMCPALFSLCLMSVEFNVQEDNRVKQVLQIWQICAVYCTE